MSILRLTSLIGVLLLTLAGQARADSPLTSTDFWRAYRDVPEVVMAHDIERLNTQLAIFLLSEAPLDRKAAVINALSWNFHGKQNAALFCEVAGKRHQVAPEQVESHLTGPETFCLAYLTALDDYFHPEPAKRLMDRARKALPRSFTVAMIGALIQCQIDFSHWERIWPMTRAVLDDKSLKLDMRPQARDIIVDYMRLYEKHARRK